VALFRPFWSAAATLIFIKRDDPSFLQGETSNEIPHGQDPRFWVDCSYEDKRHENPDRTRAELIAEILREYDKNDPHLTTASKRRNLRRDHYCHTNSVRATSSVRADMIFGRDRAWHEKSSSDWLN
jgi:hypothetical protein